MMEFESHTRSNNFIIFNRLDKLGQTRTMEYDKKPIKTYGRGADIEDEERVLSRAKRKHISQVIAWGLIKKAQKENDSELEKSFRNSYNCLNRIIVADGKYYGKYCQNRNCTVCNSIRKAEMINKYLPVIKNWEEPYHVILSMTTCFAKDLDFEMKKMNPDLSRTIERLRKRNKRGRGPEIKGIKSLECTFNPIHRWYHPHFHLIVPSREVAILLIVEWQRTKTRKFCCPAAQKKYKIKDLERDLIEVIKYGTKIFTEPNPNNKNNKKATSFVYISALYNILRSMKGIRLFDRFGFNLPNKDNFGKAEMKTFFDYDELIYKKDIMDWVNEDTGETLTNYTPTPELMNLLTNNIDNELS